VSNARITRRKSYLSAMGIGVARGVAVGHLTTNMAVQTLIAINRQPFVIDSTGSRDVRVEVT
jgi:hypothetical protein